jgi:hypothetical protein
MFAAMARRGWLPLACVSNAGNHRVPDPEPGSWLALAVWLGSTRTAAVAPMHAVPRHQGVDVRSRGCDCSIRTARLRFAIACV